MLQILKETHISFSKARYWGFIVSGALIVLTLVLLLINGGPNYGIDFAGGSKIEIKTSERIDDDELRQILSDLGENEVKIFRFGGNRVQIQVPPREIELEGDHKTFSATLIETLEQRYPGNEVTLIGQENVSAAFGKELQWDAILALLIGMGLILIYIWIRIDFRFGVGTVLAVFHDVWITLGIITLIGIRIDITVIAGLLTIIGYSVNDSIVISKNIQELLKTKRGASLTENVDEGINNALPRTIITSLTTLFVSLALVIFAGNTAIYPFAMTMTLGVVVGTYSSAFIVAPTVIELDRMFPSKHHKK
jgi:preprotein translocase subunit SecF